MQPAMQVTNGSDLSSGVLILPKRKIRISLVTFTVLVYGTKFVPNKQPTEVLSELSEGVGSGVEVVTYPPKYWTRTNFKIMALPKN